MITFFVTILIMSLFCIGMNLLMQKGQLFSFMREPFVQMMEGVEAEYKMHKDKLLLEYQEAKEAVSRKHYHDTCRMLNDQEKQAFNEDVNKLRSAHEINLAYLEQDKQNELYKFKFIKPLFLCVKCFASFWGSLIFWGLHLFLFKDLSQDLIFIWVISCIICVVFNAVFDELIRKLGIYE